MTDVTAENLNPDTPVDATVDGAPVDATLLGDATAKTGDATAKTGDAAKTEGDDAKVEGDGAEKTDAEKAEGEKKDGDKAEPDSTPYEGLTAPEGFAAIDADAMAAATPIFRSLGIDTTEKAQAALNQFAPVISGMVEKAVTQAATAQSEGITQMSADWVEQARADKEFGGAKFEENLAHAARFRDRFFTTDEGKALVREAPIFNHPEVLRAIIAAGRELGEDTIHRTDHGQQDPKTLGQTFYGDMKPVDKQ